MEGIEARVETINNVTGSGGNKCICREIPLLIVRSWRSKVSKLFTLGRCSATIGSPWNFYWYKWREKPLDVINLPLVTVIIAPLIGTIRINKLFTRATRGRSVGTMDSPFCRFLSSANSRWEVIKSTKIDLLRHGRCWLKRPYRNKLPPFNANCTFLSDIKWGVINQ
jgi:hypothetical protein